MWDFLAHALFIVDIIACLHYVMSTVETDRTHQRKSRCDTSQRACQPGVLGPFNGQRIATMLRSLR
jgi:hypothetical protein